MPPASTAAESVRGLTDIERWEGPGTPLAVLGHPIAHSLSPAMHTAALAAEARTSPRFADWQYVRFDVPPDDLGKALTLLHSRGFLGINLTLPHKVLATGLVAAIDPGAQRAGAVNTLLRQEKGWTGFNTDGYGLTMALREEFGLRLGGLPVVIIGAGGAARGAALACIEAGCSALWIANRTKGRREELLALLRPLAGSIPLHGFAPETPPPDLPVGALVIQATASGMKSGDVPPIELGAVSRPVAVYEMIYRPPRTPVLSRADALGVPWANGLSMLVHQGARSLEIWSGIPAERSAPLMAAAAKAASERY